MKYSVIIRCRNEERWIGHCIQSCEDFLNEPEIIFVDNESTDTSRDIVNMFRTNVKFLKIDNYSPGRSINMGVQESKHSNILILSSHCVLKEFNAAKCSSYLHKYAAVFGNQIPVYRGKRIKKRYIWSHFVSSPVVDMFSKIENRCFLHNGMSVYKRRFLIEHPFDENLYGKEDRYWAQNILNKGYHYLYSPVFSCEHHWTEGGSTWKGLG